MSDAGESGFRGDESSIPSTASTHLMENTTGGKAYDLSGSVTSSAPGSLVGSAPGSSIVGSTNASGPGSAAGSGSGVGMSRSAMAASRLLRSRGGPRTKAAQQLMERLVPSSRAGAAAKNDDSSKETEPGKEKDKEPSKAAAAAARSSLRARVKSRRLAGGAYAKTMLNGKDKVDDSGKGEGAKEEEPAQEETTPTDDVDLDHIQEVTKAASAELDDARKQAVDEFARGTTHNTRYHALTRLIESHDDDEDMSEASMPSVLNRSEIFHENAAAAVMALLTPRRSSDAASQMTSHSLDEAGLKVTNTKKGLMITAEHQKTSAFRGPRSPATNGIDMSASCVSGLSSQLDISYEGAVPQSPITNPILSVDAERALNAVKRRMMDPSKTLSDLLQAIATPEDGSIMDRGFMVRRKNACGAIKVLAATGSNRRTMCWTAGVLPALTSVLADTGDEGLLESFPNSRTRAEYFEARKRAVATLVNLSIPKENRIPIFHSPGLVQAVVCVINDDREEARQGCCALIAYLCKTAENRLLMTQVPGLLSAVGGVISPPKPDEHPISQIKPRKKYHWDDDDTETSNEQEDSFSTADDRNTSSDSYDRYTVTDGESSMRDSRTFDEEGSEVTPRAATMSFESRRQVFPHYDKDPNKWLHASRQNVFAAMLHLVKEKDNAYAFARHETLMVTLVEISKLHDSPSHVLALKIIAHVTRHRSNSKHIVFKIKIVVPALVDATNSLHDEGRQYAMYALQNLSQDRYCRTELANTMDLILSLCQRARQAPVGEEKTAAVSALKNLTDDPSNLIPMSNTSECFATLMQIAHGSDIKDENLQYLACDALSTLSHWLRKIATSGSAPPGQASTTTKLYVPSLKVVTWSQWE